MVTRKIALTVGLAAALLGGVQRQALSQPAPAPAPAPPPAAAPAQPPPGAAPETAPPPATTTPEATPPPVAPPAAPPATPPAAPVVAEPPPPPGPPLPSDRAPIPDRRFVFSNLFALRYNPLGLENQLRMGWQQRLYRNAGALYRDNFYFIGLYPRFNPAFIKFGPAVEIQPLSIFNLRVTAEYVDFLSTFGFVQSFNSPTADYSDSRLQRGRDNAENYPTQAFHLNIEPSIRFKIGPLVFRNRLSIEYWRARLRTGDIGFYDQTLDTLVPGNGWVLSNDMDLIYLYRKWIFGVRYSLVQPIYRAGDYQPGETVQTLRNGHHRIGPIVGFTFFDRGFTRFNRPTIILITNWYLKHNYRTGAEVSQGVPYVVLAFAFDSSLLP